MSTYNLFTSESVSEGHPDKMADQISDAVLDAIIKDDPNSRVAVETMVKTGMAIIAGEVRTNTYVDLEQIVRDVITRLVTTAQMLDLMAIAVQYSMLLVSSLETLHRV